MQFSFVVHQSGEAIAHDQLLRIVERCNAEAEAVTRAHQGPFVVVHRDPIAPVSNRIRSLRWRMRIP